MKKIEKIIFTSMLATLLLSFTGYINNIDYWIIDILSHFKFQYLLISLVILLASLRVKKVNLIVVAVLLFLFNLVSLLGFGETLQAAEKSDNAIMVYSANINRFNDNFENMESEIQGLDAEIVILIEVTPRHLNLLQPIMERFPYHIHYTPVGKRELGVALFTKFPILDNKLTKLSDVGNLLLEATLDIDNEKVAVFALHAQSPLSGEDFQDRKNQFVGLAQRISQMSIPVIVAGDFNATPYSPIFRELLKVSGLKDSGRYFGWQPSWPAGFPAFWIPIDHILVSPDFQIHSRSTGSNIGSDHYPVVAELSLAL